MNLQIVVLVVTSASICSGATIDILAPKKCPDVTLQANFNTEKFMGTWYEIQAMPSEFWPIEACSKGDYTRVSSDVVEIKSTGFNNDGLAENLTSKMTITKDPARMLTEFFQGITPPYHVLDTDYTSYACIHSCLAFGPIRNEFVWIYSRQNTLDKAKVEKCRTIFTQLGGTLDLNTLTNTRQEGCV